MAVATTRVGPKRRKIAKSRKKSWKNIDVSQVEEFLEDERLQERTGGLVADKKNEQLFFVDKDAEDLARKPVQKRKKGPTIFKCYANLEPDPLIKPARVAHNVKKSGVSAKVQKQLEKKAKSVKLIQIRKQQQEARRERLKRIRSKNKLPIATFDIWSGNAKNESSETTRLPEELDHCLAVTKKRRVKVPPRYQQSTSVVPAVEVPHPGASYNPALEDYEDLILKANEVEEKKLKEEKKLYNALEGKFPERNICLDKIWLEEMTAGLLDTKKKDDDNDDVEEDPDKISVNPPVRRENFKTKKQKRKEKEEKLKLNEIKKLKIKKKIENEVYRVKSLKKEIEKKTREYQQRLMKKEAIKEKSKLQPKRLGKHKFEEPELELKLTDELVGSLRLLKPEGHLLEDRFKSLQKRNIIEPRVRAKRKRTYKPKKIEKKSYKEITI